MIERKQQLIISFESTHTAIRFEKLCQEHRIAGRIIPLPSRISAGCGLAWKAEPDQEERIRLFMNEHGIEGKVHIIT